MSPDPRNIFLRQCRELTVRTGPKAEAGDQLVSEMCRGAATDKDGLKRDNDGVPEAQAVLVSGKMNTTSPDDPCGGKSPPSDPRCSPI